MMHELTPRSPAPEPGPEHPFERGGRLLLLGLMSAMAVALGLGVTLRSAPRPAPTIAVIEHGRRLELPDFNPALTSVTPITSLTASGPTQLGGSTTGALYAPDADRIYIRARTGSSTATLNLVEWIPEDAKWTKVGADCSVDTSLTTCRYVAARGARYWHVYKASGTMAFTGIEPVYGAGASLGSIEPAGSSISLPLGVSDGGTGLTSFTANRLFYSSSTSAIGQLGCSDGQVPTWSSGALVCSTPSSGGVTAAPVWCVAPGAGSFGFNLVTYFKADGTVTSVYTDDAPRYFAVGSKVRVTCAVDSLAVSSDLQCGFDTADRARPSGYNVRDYATITSGAGAHATASTSAYTILSGYPWVHLWARYANGISSYSGNAVVCLEVVS